MKKNILYILGVCFCFVYFLILGGCNESDKTIITSEFYIFIDVTDTLNRDEKIFTNDAEKIIDKMNLSIENGGLSGGIVKFFLLSETSSSPYKSVEIEKGANSYFDERSNKYIRGEEIKEFSEKINLTINEILYDVDWEKENSKIYQQLCREINRLAKLSTADQKIIIIYSDMLENSKLFSFYGRKIKEIEHWMANKDRIKIAYEQRLSTDCKLPTKEEGIDEIEIYFVSKRTRTNDEKVNLAERFWSTLFSTQGIKGVHFGSELKLY